MRPEYILAFHKCTFKYNYSVTPGLYFHPINYGDGQWQDQTKEFCYEHTQIPILNPLNDLSCYNDVTRTEAESVLLPPKKIKRPEIESKWLYEQGGGDQMFITTPDD
jgi:hypothetical protein